MNFGAGFQIGMSALAAGQHAMNVAGNNMANAATAGYRRQRVGMIPTNGPAWLGIGRFGDGVRVGGVTRAIDMALLARLRHARADEAGHVTSSMRLGSIEGIFATTGEGGVAGAVQAFLAGWGKAGESPDDAAIRGVIVQQGVGLAHQLRTLRDQLVLERDEIDRSLQDGVNHAHALLEEIAELSGQIKAAESAGGAAPALRDQRDLLVDELSTLIDLSVVDRPDGTLDLLVGSTPIMLSGASLGIEISQVNPVGGLSTIVDQAPLAAGGSLGALIARRADGVQSEIARLDTLARELIRAVNRIHVEGRGLHERTSMTAFLGVLDPTVPLTQLGLAPPVTAGTIKIQYTQAGSANPNVLLVQVDPSTDSLNQVAAAINTAVGAAVASVNGQNQLVMNAQPGWEFSVLEDPTGLFTAIEFGGFFTGVDASDIDVAAELVSDPSLLSMAQGEDASAVANKMVALQGATIAAFNTTMGEWWLAGDAALAQRVNSATSAADAAGIVRLGLESQELALTGVSLDEEAMNLMSAQSQYEAAARYVSAMQEALDSLLRMAAR